MSGAGSSAGDSWAKADKVHRNTNEHEDITGADQEGWGWSPEAPPHAQERRTGGEVLGAKARGGPRARGRRAARSSWARANAQGNPSAGGAEAKATADTPSKEQS